MRRLFIAATLALAACASSVGPTNPFVKETTVAQGKTVEIVDDVSVHFVGVEGDSRCPGDAICIKGGDAVVRLRVTNAGNTREVELHTGNSRPAASGDLVIELLQLMPYPFSSLPPIEPDDYQATLRVRR